MSSRRTLTRAERALMETDEYLVKDAVRRMLDALEIEEEIERTHSVVKEMQKTNNFAGLSALNPNFFGNVYARLQEKRDEAAAASAAAAASSTTATTPTQTRTPAAETTTTTK
ncbi:unnamed protein product [Caenorhabditis auriculariae]|uniref:Uncharacterized protein n=1 Tax=Caenorhabditis auriculariae TaxID=2777116 RepID=A0A8S1H5R4_9PELO|nr:unnamed protein product [Caenorhabditis auriculariae]